MRTRWLAVSVLLAAPVAAQTLPTITVTADDTVIDRSCRVVIPAGTVITDANGDGVIHIRTPRITVEFAEDAVLAGAPTETPGDELTGLGIVIHGADNVTLKDARVRGYKVGVHARNADDLVVDGADLSGNLRQRLKSTPQAEDGGDWLWPHRNDANEWMTSYGAALVVEDSEGATIRGVRVRRGQNGIILDRVARSMIYDNDCSFLSGWGLAMWRCSNNVVSRNAFDFCVRGYSHGVYNRGQDSAGILLFEQNRENLIAENSATHGGDGFFAFGGREALGEDPASVPPGFDHKRAGNRANIIIANDFSYAPAHGLELTFSFDNVVRDNRFVENAICGIWGGYSQETLIVGNTFEGNGGMAYGLERGGVNIEHGAGNRIIGNTFRKNTCGVHLWWDVDEGLMKSAWAGANERGKGGAGARRVPSIDNLIADNTFEGDKVAIHLRDCDGTVAIRNRFIGVDKEIDATPGSEPMANEETAVSWAMPEYPVHGTTKPVGARAWLMGRDKIEMTEWGPWDHESPLVRFRGSEGDRHIYEFFGIEPEHVSLEGRGVRLEPATVVTKHPTHAVIAPEPGVFPYRLRIKQPAIRRYGRAGKAAVVLNAHNEDISRTIVNAAWDVVFFGWEAPEPQVDEQGTPRVPPDLEAWRELARGRGAVRTTVSRLAFRHAMGGPSDAAEDPAVKGARLPRDYFGMIARTRLPLRAGTWRIRTQSDDGVRVLVDGRAVIENWTHHGPTKDAGEFTVDRDREVEIVVEHFEIAGFAVLELDLEPVAEPSR